MTGWYRFWYGFWRWVGSMAYGVFHFSQAQAHNSYLRGGRWGRRNRKPMTAVWRLFGGGRNE